MNDDQTYLELEENWVRLIGRFMLDFASIEDSIHRVLLRYLQDTLITEDELNDTFKKRLKLFQKILIKNFSKSFDLKILKVTIDRILGLYQTRNLLAHNSISYTFVEDEKGQFRFMGFEISSRKNESSCMTHEKLKEEILELKKCRDAIASFMLEFHKAELDLN